MKIYTKTGDQGETSLLGGKRVSKTDKRIETAGEIDELCSCLGVVRSLKLDKRTDQLLEKIQRDLFIIECLIASPLRHSSLPRITKKDTALLEKAIDDMDSKLPELRNFILPAGSMVASLLHLARTVCRRSERRVVCLGRNNHPEILPYLNRLSDFLFVLARFENAQEKKKEVIWKGMI